MTSIYSTVEIDLLQHCNGVASVLMEAHALVDVLTENTRLCEDNFHEVYINILYGKMTEVREELDALRIRIENPLMTAEERAKAVQTGGAK